MSNALRTTHCELKANVHALDYNYNRAIGGVKSSCTTYRAQLQDIRKICDKLRKLTLVHQRELPVKKRVKKPVEPTSDDEDGEATVVVVDKPAPKTKRGRKKKLVVEPVASDDEGVEE